MIDITVLTDERYVDPNNLNPYTNNVLKEDQLVIDALKTQGLSVQKKAWSDPDYDWSTTQYALFRTTWDYAERFQEFSSWVHMVSKKTTLINSYDLITWNLDKHYLLDLQKRGVEIVETYFIEPRDNRSLYELHDELGWEQTVLKPVVSAAAKDTFKLDRSVLDAHEAHYRTLIASEAMMLQPFQHDVIDRGELSLMVFGGVYTHTVIKKAKQGDFRVQDDFGGTVDVYEPSPEEIDLAIRSVNACDPVPIYARVDMINDNEGKPAISELELVEPELWFRNEPSAAERLAETVVSTFNL